MFIIGLITGILIAILNVALLIYLRKPIEKVERKVRMLEPDLRGFVFNPPDEAEEVRQEIINRNKEKGQDTYFKDLI